MLLTWSDELVCGLSSHLDESAIGALMATFAAYTEFTMKVIADRRANPSDDLFSVLVNAEVEGQHHEHEQREPQPQCRCADAVDAHAQPFAVEALWLACGCLGSE